MSTLAEAFATKQGFILIDNQQDLLLLAENKLFSGLLLNSIESFPLDPTLNHVSLKAWLDTYLGLSYTLHPFDATSVLHYVDVLALDPIVSDFTLLNRSHEHVKYQTLRELFLLDGKLIDLPALDEEGFFATYRSRLHFRVERFHEVFFKLTLKEQIHLLDFIEAYRFPAANYPTLSLAENEFLTTYTNKLYDLISDIPSCEFSATNFLDAAIAAHEKILATESSLSHSEKKHIFSELKLLKSRLGTFEPGMRSKAALQLFVLLFPSVIRAVAKKDPLELATPIVLIASDAVLREVLIKLVTHPQVIDIFAGKLASKVLGIVSETVDRVPIVGSVLAAYGLVQSGRALSNSYRDDPNRPYYAHLLMNNLLTVGLIMGAEVATSLPFWPVLGLFMLLTVDQIGTEGGRVTM